VSIHCNALVTLELRNARLYTELKIGHSRGGRIMAAAVKASFICPNCNALYRMVRQEAGPETVDRQITCRACGAPLPSREGKFVLKYFLLRNGGRIQRWRKPRLAPELQSKKKDHTPQSVAPESVT
jgi:predicted RNA-binding Zn-ribbon protein involved in translation (DUF1610 family)